MLVAWWTAVRTNADTAYSLNHKKPSRFMHPLSKNTSPRLLGKPDAAVTTSNIKRVRHWPVLRPFILMPVSDAICCACVYGATRFAVNAEFEKPEIVIPLFSPPPSISLYHYLFFFSSFETKSRLGENKNDPFMCNVHAAYYI